MSVEEQDKDGFTFKYVIPDDLKDCFVNGVWGATNPQGQIHMHLYSERLPIPNTETHDIVDGEIQKEPTQRDAGGDLVRLVQSSVVMDIRTAIVLQRWLGDRIKYYFKGLEEEKKKEENDEN